MKRFTSFLTCLFILFSAAPCMVQAQDTGPQMADVMRSNGKIYVVVAVLVVVFIGIILYLVRMERKVRRLEKQDHPHS